MKKELKVAVAGVGTVGAGVIQNISDNHALFLRRTGVSLLVTDISSRTKTGRSVDILPYKWHDHPLDLVKTDVDIIVETIGGEDGIALDIVKQALQSRKHVVTANKALLAKHGNDLAKLAEDNNVSLCYEAAVAGGIPIVKALREGLAGNNHRRIYGILNGTCNYMLSKMENTGADFNSILKEAQDLGYAEADPTLDIGGFDAAHKLTILSSIAFGIPINYSQTSVEGIEGITKTDIYYAKKLGFNIRLFGIARQHNGKISQAVYPVMIAPDMHGANVQGAYNAVIIQSDYAQDSVLVGCGAGREPTASAVVADILDIAKGNYSPVFGVHMGALETPIYAELSEREGAYYIRLELEHKAGALAEITALLARNNISVESLIQQDTEHTQTREVIILTHETTEDVLLKSLEAINKSDYSKAKPAMIRIMPR